MWYASLDNNCGCNTKHCLAKTRDVPQCPPKAFHLALIINWTSFKQRCCRSCVDWDCLKNFKWGCMGKDISCFFQQKHISWTFQMRFCTGWVYNLYIFKKYDPFFTNLLIFLKIWPKCTEEICENIDPNVLIFCKKQPMLRGAYRTRYSGRAPPRGHFTHIFHRNSIWETVWWQYIF